MKFFKEIVLKDGRKCTIRNAEYQDGAEILELFKRVHGETDFLLTYPEEHELTVEEESEYHKSKADSETEVELLAVIDGKIVGTAGVSAVGKRMKIKHRSEFGISILKEYWGLGIGKELTNCCIECARKGGFTQVDLDAVADNTAAIDMYKKAGFIEYGRNPKGFISKYSGYQTLVLMRLEL